MSWFDVKLKDICSLVTSGGTPLRSVSEYYEGGTIPWMKTGEVKRGLVFETEEYITEKALKESSAKLIPINSLIVAMYGDGITAGNVAINKIPLATNQACCNFVIDPEKAFYKFIYFYLKASYSNLVGLKLGGSQQNLNAKSLKEFPLRIPELAVQKKIAAALSSYDDLIENNRRRIELLEHMAEELYREWFVRFRFPGYQQAKFEKGSPITWQKKKFGEFCGLKRGYDLPDAQIEDGSFPIIASTSIKAFHNQFKVEPPVICTGRSGSLGTVLFVSERAWPLNTALYVQKLYGNSPYLIYFTLKNMGLASFNSGAGVPSLNRNHLNGISIAVPDKPLQQAFDKHISVLFDKKEKLVEAGSSLQKMRNALLTRLISGKLPVDQLDIQFPPSMREADAARQEVAHA